MQEPSLLKTLAVVAIYGPLLSSIRVPTQLGAQDPLLPHPVMFVTQPPIANDFATIGSTFANHGAELKKVGRGGDLWIRYTDGSLRNLTREAGFGTAESFQGEGSIAVRDPNVHFDGDRALFSMVLGSTEEQFVYETYRWQIYEVQGLGSDDEVLIERVANQPTDYNNITPIYSSDGAIVFTSDRPRNGEIQLYPQLDEYESTPTNTGLWRLEPETGELRMLQHSPSGSFEPFVDSFGRIVFTRWDHLQRDQQRDADDQNEDRDPYGTFDYRDERAGARRIPREPELFPEPRVSRRDLLEGTQLVGHTLNHFFPWEIRPDGTGELTLNHVGRHELHDYFDRSLRGDGNIREFIAIEAGERYPTLENFFQIAESPVEPGVYYGINAPEFRTHASGQLVRLDAPVGRPADEIRSIWLTAPETSEVVDDDAPRPEDHSGFYRDPLPLSDGRLLVVHTDEVRAANNEGTRAQPAPRYAFRLRLLEEAANWLEAGEPITPELSRSLSWYDPDVLVEYEGPLWQLQPVEVRARPRPPVLVDELPAAETSIFEEEDVDVGAFRSYLREKDLALIVARDVTARDEKDRQQPWQIRVPGGRERAANEGTVYEVEYLQIFQAMQLRGMGGIQIPRRGRRVLARHLDLGLEEDPNPANGGPPGSARIAEDGSVAAFVPARRAISWQTTSGDGEPVVRERYWLTAQAGEIRVCSSCHGVNSRDQVGEAPSTQSPEALRQLLRHWVEGQTPDATDVFRRADATDDGRVDLSDGVAVLLSLFAGDRLTCIDAADSDDDGAVNLTDAVAIFSFLFQGGMAPPAPGPSDCGVDPSADALDCARFESCE